MSGTQDLTLHILRNPYGWGDDVVRATRVAAADRIELLERQNVDLHDALVLLLKQVDQACGTTIPLTSFSGGRFAARAALSKVQQQPDCAREPGALTQPAISPAPSWISVADRLPGDSSDVIAYCEDTGEQFVGFHIGGGEFQFAVDHRGQEIVCTPTHWMPCPAAPVGSADSQKGGA